MTRAKPYSQISCQAPGCSSPTKSNGYCAKHLSQIARHGKLTPERERTPKQTCSVPGCTLKAIRKGYCNTHSAQFYKYGHIPTEEEIKKAWHKAAKARMVNRLKKYGRICKDVECKKRGFGEYCGLHSTKDHTAKKLYGITWQEKTTMWIAQHHKCFICGKNQTLSEICIDHTEGTNGNPVVRGLLCKKCNIGIGNLDHNIDNLRRAISYLQNEQYSTHINYTPGELIDKLSIIDLKIYYITEHLNSGIPLDNKEKDGIKQQLITLKDFRKRLITALAYATDEKTGIQIANISGINLSIWLAEDSLSQAGDNKLNEKEVSSILDDIVKDNKERSDIIESINEFFDNKINE